MSHRAWVVLLMVTLAGACSKPTPTTPTPVFVPQLLPTFPPDAPAVITTMLNGMLAYFDQALAYNQQELPFNPGTASLIQAKINMLTSKIALGTDIINGRRWASGQALSVRGTPVGAIFALEAMRGDANAAVGTFASAVPVLEDFFGEAFPSSSVQVWYGFTIGDSGGSVIQMEERSSYESRPTLGLPYGAIVCHELSHSYMSSEAFNQFLEMYVYNKLQGASTDPNTWSHTRNWMPGASLNVGSAALLDVYQLIGFDAMRAAYRAIRPLRPPYGVPITNAIIDAFLTQVSPDLQALVRAKLMTIIA